MLPEVPNKDPNPDIPDPPQQQIPDKALFVEDFYFRKSQDNDLVKEAFGIEVCIFASAKSKFGGSKLRLFQIWTILLTANFDANNICISGTFNTPALVQLLLKHEGPTTESLALRVTVITTSISITKTTTTAGATITTKNITTTTTSTTSTTSTTKTITITTTTKTTATAKTIKATASSACNALYYR
ncbi:hypothetical protein HK100_000171 [Physocladia obscura]|uniref:Uncharacterized protein n=1 Tax=Physocladia obscura TaxID=109957 RepID=A0AAD5SZ45_9FUNG|nr:hypothetical protein HK100_000171 [Physocladia obscura]